LYCCCVFLLLLCFLCFHCYCIDVFMMCVLSHLNKDYLLTYLHSQSLTPAAVILSSTNLAVGRCRLYVVTDTPVISERRSLTQKIDTFWPHLDTERRVGDSDGIALNSYKTALGAADATQHDRLDVPSSRLVCLTSHIRQSALTTYGVRTFCIILLVLEIGLNSRGVSTFGTILNLMKATIKFIVKSSNRN